MRLAIKLCAMAHGIPCRIINNDALACYKAIAKLHGMSLERRMGGFILH